jgi:hypothetical protein
VDRPTWGGVVGPLGATAGATACHALRLSVASNRTAVAIEPADRRPRHEGTPTGPRGPSTTFERQRIGRRALSYAPGLSSRSGAHGDRRLATCTRQPPCCRSTCPSWATQVLTDPAGRLLASSKAPAALHGQRRPTLQALILELGRRLRLSTCRLIGRLARYDSDEFLDATAGRARRTGSGHQPSRPLISTS